MDHSHPVPSLCTWKMQGTTPNLAVFTTMMTQVQTRQPVIYGEVPSQLFAAKDPLGETHQAKGMTQEEQRSPGTPL